MTLRAADVDMLSGAAHGATKWQRQLRRHADCLQNSGAHLVMSRDGISTHGNGRYGYFDFRNTAALLKMLGLLRFGFFDAA